MSPDSRPRGRQTARLHAMFNQEYKGSTVKDFCDTLKEYNRFYDRNQHFGRFISIVQSSGTGKSRLVWELRHKVNSSLFPLYVKPIPHFATGANPLRLLPRK